MPRWKVNCPSAFVMCPTLRNQKSGWRLNRVSYFFATLHMCMSVDSPPQRNGADVVGGGSGVVLEQAADNTTSAETSAPSIRVLMSPPIHS